MAFATLDPEADDNKQVITGNDVIDKVANDPYFQKDLRKLDDSPRINFEIASEVLSILQENEGLMFGSSEGNSFIDWETEPIAYQILRRAGESEPAELIKSHRTFDFITWARIPPREGARGCRLRFRNPDYQPTREEKAMIREWEMKIFESFFFPPNEYYANFGKFIGAAYRDWFDLDDITIEFRMDGFGRPIAVHLQDPIIIKPIVKKRKYTRGGIYSDVEDILNDYEKLLDNEIYADSKEEDDADYLLLYNNKRFAALTRERARKFHYFTRSDFRKANRGYGVVEKGIKTLTNILNALTWNASNFNSRQFNSMIALTGGGVNAVALEKLKKTLYANMSGPANASRFPMISLNGEKADAKVLNMRQNSKDFEFHQGTTLLFSIWCKLSGTDPNELSLATYKDAVGKPGLFNDTADGVVKESKDSGARTFLTHFADSMNVPNKDGMNIFQIITQMDLKLEFTGFEVEDAKVKAELRDKDLTTIKCVNDLLAEQDIERQELMLGDKNVYDVPGFYNPQIYQTVLFNAQQAMQKAQGGMPGQPGAEQDPAAQAQQQGVQLTDKDQGLLKKYQEQKSGKPSMNGELQDELQQGQAR